MSSKKLRLLKEPTIGFCLATIIAGSILLGYAISLQNLYNNAPTKVINRNLQGFVVVQNETGMSTNFLMMSINLEPPQLAIFYSVELESNGTYIIDFHFPFRIREINQTQSYPVKSHFELDNDLTDGSSILITLNRQEGLDNVTQSLSAQCPIEETFVSGRRGTYSANIRFTFLGAMGHFILDSPLINETYWESGFLRAPPTLLPLRNFFLAFAYPERMTITQASPEYTVGPLSYPSSPQSPNVTSISWYYEQVNSGDLSFTIQYTDNQENDGYQLMLFNSGLWYGIGFSVVLTGVFELARKVIDIKKKRHHNAKPLTQTR